MISDCARRSVSDSAPNTSHFSPITSHFSQREPKASAALAGVTGTRITAAGAVDSRPVRK